MIPWDTVITPSSSVSLPKKQEPGISFGSTHDIQKNVPVVRTCSKNVRTNAAWDFLKLIDKHFPKSTPLHKIFNRNIIKVSYSCMNNVKSVISKHNKHLLRETSSQQSRNDKNNEKLCNCWNANERPLNDMCLTKNIVNKAELQSKENKETKTYFWKEIKNNIALSGPSYP